MLFYSKKLNWIEKEQDNNKNIQEKEWDKKRLLTSFLFFRHSVLSDAEFSFIAVSCDSVHPSAAATGMVKG